MKLSRPVALQALLQAAGVSLYIGLVSWLMFSISQWLPREDTFLTPVTFLLLFVLSAAVVGSLVLGLPILLYLDNQKKEALKLLGATLLWLFIIFVILILVQIGL